jgi:GNAT superfamily N-acetyltransferase
MTTSSTHYARRVGVDGRAIAAVDSAALAGHTGELGALYRACFAEPPWCEPEERLAGFPERFAGHLAQPGAHGLLARDGTELAGAVYGWPAPGAPDSAAHAKVFGAVDPARRHLLRHPALEVVELMVAPRHRGRGLGRALLRRFVDGHRRAWLCTHPDAPVRRLYDSEGWVVLGSFTDHAGVPLLVYLLDRS